MPHEKSQPVYEFRRRGPQSQFRGRRTRIGVGAVIGGESVARLESDLGVRLSHRTTRAVSLTSEGDALLAKCARVLDEIDALQLLSTGAADTPTGTLRIGAPIGYGTRKIVPVLNRLLEAHSLLSVEMQLSDKRVNMITEGLDAVVRIGSLDDSGMRRVRSTGSICCCVQVLSTSKHMARCARLPNSKRVRLLPDHRPAPLPVSVLTPGARMLPPRVRAFIDALAEEYAF
nr:LysR substrate-binding domain-containing protein [Paraburkholderia sp. BCC1885]